MLFCLTYSWPIQTTTHQWGSDCRYYFSKSHSWKCLSQREHSIWSAYQLKCCKLLHFRRIDFSKLLVGECIQTALFLSAAAFLSTTSSVCQNVKYGSKYPNNRLGLEFFSYTFWSVEVIRIYFVIKSLCECVWQGVIITNIFTSSGHPHSDFILNQALTSVETVTVTTHIHSCILI